jgi:hypothetical protein
MNNPTYGEMQSGLCRLFVDTVDYGAYMENHGCHFGRFTCCPGVNITLRNEYADECGVADLCYNYGPEVFMCIVLVFAFILLIMRCALYTRDGYSVLE